MRFVVRNTLTRVEASLEEQDWLTEYLSFDVRSHTHATIVESMYSRATGTFLTGLLPIVRKAARKAGFETKTDDKRNPWIEPDLEADIGWLEPYQRAAIDAVLKHRRGVIQMIMAGGKGELIPALTMVLPCRWTIFVHRMNLAKDLASRCENRTQEPVGIIGGGKWRVPPKARIVCATFQTMSRALIAGDDRAVKLLDETQALAVDEVHTLPAVTHRRCVYAARNAYYRVGLSATAFKRRIQHTNLQTIANIGPMLVKVSAPDLIALDRIAKPRIRMVIIEQNLDDMPDADLLEPTWPDTYRELIVKSDKRNAALLKLAQVCQKPAMLFVKAIKHGKRLIRLVQQAGIRSEFVWGDVAPATREYHAKRLNQGDLDLIVANEVFYDGVNVPALKTVIVGTGRKSTIETIQRIGRGMRLDRAPDGTTRQGGNEFDVWDCMDVGVSSLNRHSKRRQSDYEGEGFDVELVSLLALDSLQSDG